MVKHLPLMTSRTPLEQYQVDVERALDAFKHGNATQEQALAHAERAAGLLVDSLRSHFLVRLHNLEAMRTPRGERLAVEGQD